MSDIPYYMYGTARVLEKLTTLALEKAIGDWVKMSALRIILAALF